MRILFINLISFWKMHFAEELDLIQRHIENNDEVYILKCNESLPNGCGVEINKSKSRCLLCKSEFITAINMTGIKNKINVIDIDLSKYKCPKMRNINTIEQLKQVYVDNYDVGKSIASLFISDLRDAAIKLNEKEKKIAISHYENLVKYLNFLDEKVQEHKIDHIYVFNGRLPYYRMALRVGQHLNIKTTVHERSYKINKYMLCKNTYPHDIDYMKNQMNLLWLNETDFNKKKHIGDQWYAERKVGSNKAMIHYIANQDLRKQIEMDSNKVNVGIFISSEDEMAAIDEWRNTLYKNQNEALKQIVSSDCWSHNIHFYLRIHPNLKGLINEQTIFANNINWEKMTIIPADSSISTYRLMEDVNIVLVFGSTVGIEACNMRKPTICAGRALYEDFKGIFKPRSHEELCEWINNYPNHNIDLDEAYLSSLKYAWFFETFGQEFKYFKQDGYNSIRYLGRKSIWSVKYHFTQKLINIRKKIIDKFIC